MDATIARAYRSSPSVAIGDEGLPECRSAFSGWAKRDSPPRLLARVALPTNADHVSAVNVRTVSFSDTHEQGRGRTERSPEKGDV